MNRIQLTPVLLIAFGFLVGGCGGSKTPPPETVRAATAGVIPPYVRLQSLEFEPVAEGAFNFKATVSTKEALFVKASGEVPLDFLKQVQSEGANLNLYGRFIALKAMDKWSIEHIELTDGAAALGQPRGNFADAFVLGSPEATRAIADYRAAQERARREAELEQERVRVAAAKAAAERHKQEQAAREKRAAEQAQFRAKVASVVRTGQAFTGTITIGREFIPVEAAFKEVSGTSVVMVVAKRTDPKVTLVYQGELEIDAAASEARLRLTESERNVNFWPGYMPNSMPVSVVGTKLEGRIVDFCTMTLTPRS